MEWELPTIGEDGYIRIPEHWVFLHYYEAFNLLFRIENALRVFVYLILKNERGKDWATETINMGEGGNATINGLAKKRITQSKYFGYLSSPVTNPIAHLTSGELVHLITSKAYWPIFKQFFYGKREIMRTKLDEIGTIRNSLAHFRPIKADDVDVIKQNSRHVLVGVEKLLNAAFLQDDNVPTNTEDDWYKSLSTLGSDHCMLALKQSSDENWICVEVMYKCAELSCTSITETYYRGHLLTLQTPNIVRMLDQIRESVTHVTENIYHRNKVDADGIQIKKGLRFVFYKPCIILSHKVLRIEFDEMIRQIESETDLIKQDNLARGKFVHTSILSASKKADSRFWKISYGKMFAPPSHDDPPEYWGNLEFNAWHEFISGMSSYPWMADSVSLEGLPF